MSSKHHETTANNQKPKVFPLVLLDVRSIALESKANYRNHNDKKE
jgi:hypothetical protein